MRSVLHVFWATMERALPRVGTAVVMLCFARYTSPEAVGIYSWVALAYTLYQAIAEMGLRTLAVLSMRNAEDLRYVRRRTRLAAVLGSALLGCVLLGLWLAYPQRWQIVAGLVPFAIVPFITTAHIVPSAVLQFDQRWRELARQQLVAAVTALTASLAIVLTVHLSLAMAVHALVTETVFLVLSRRAVRGRMPVADQGSRHPQREAPGLVTVNVLGWVQNQLERVFIGALAGPAVLGLYSTASALGRSPNEALAAATGNYVRSRVANSVDPDVHARALRTIGLISSGGAACAVLALVALLDLVFTPFLGPAYGPTLRAAPLFAVATIPLSMSLTMQLVAISSGRSKASIIAGCVGLCFSLPIGLLATVTVHWAALMVVAKEVAVLLVTYGLARPPGARLPVVLAVALTLAATGVLELFLLV